MALIATQYVVIGGAAPTFGNAAAGDTASVGAGFKLIVKNGSASSITVTVAVPGTLVNNVAAPDTVYTIAAGGEAWIPLGDFYADPSDGKAHITYSATASVTRAVVKG
jgi:hypothetical protein